MRPCKSGRNSLWFAADGKRMPVEISDKSLVQCIPPNYHSMCRNCGRTSKARIMIIQLPAVTCRKIDHIAIRVSNLRTSLEFYASLFGAKIVLSGEPVVANPNTVPCPHAWFAMNSNYIAISLALPQNGKPGLDHFCLTVDGASDADIGRALDTHGLNRKREEKWFPDVVWAQDPAENFIQFKAYPGGLQRGGADAVPLVHLAADDPLTAVEGAFKASGVTHLGLRAPDKTGAASYYRNLLGDEDRHCSSRFIFAAGPSRLELVEPHEQEFFQVGLDDFDSDIVRNTLTNLGVAAIDAEDGAVELADPDGIKLRIGASSTALSE
jgi:catechol 2,3-dioxygenase-like lactoylglutathione lyase family enzyme